LGFFRQVLKAIWYPNTELGMVFMWLQLLFCVIMIAVTLVLESLGVKGIPFWFCFAFGGFASFTVVHLVILLRYISRGVL